MVGLVANLRISATIEHQIAEGGFGYICYSTHDTSSPQIKYALKQIICPDEETRLLCRSEAKIHRTLGDSHENIMKLLGIKFLDNGNKSNKSSGGGNDGLCYMRFPLITGGSFQDEINKRCLLDDDRHGDSIVRGYFKTPEILNGFLGLLKGVKAMHDAGYAHCDIELENILLGNSNNSTSFYGDKETGGGRVNSNSSIGTPIIFQ